MIPGLIEPGGRYVTIGAEGSPERARLFVVERGKGFPLIVLHGGPGLDHHEFDTYLLPLEQTCRLILVDQRAQGRSERTPQETWTLPQMARDVSLLAQAMGLERYGVLGHSYGAFVALQHAVDDPGAAAFSIISSGVPASHYMEAGEQKLEELQPPEVREKVRASLEAEKTAQTAQDFANLINDQWPFHFADPKDPRIKVYAARTSETIYSPAVLRHFSNAGYGGIDVEDRLGNVTQPALVLHGRHDRVCPVEAGMATAKGIPGAELVIFENSAHMTFVEEPERFIEVVREFVKKHV